MLKKKNLKITMFKLSLKPTYEVRRLNFNELVISEERWLFPC